MLLKIKGHILSFLLGVAFMGAFMHLKQPPKPISQVSSNVEVKKADKAIATKKEIKKDTSPNGASTETSVEYSISHEGIISALASQAETKYEEKELRIFAGAGVNSNFTGHASVIGTYDIYAGSVKTNGVNDHSVSGHILIFKW